jgi:signal recognition particle subunit SRP54
LANIKAKTHPDNILLVVDAMMGQDAVTTAKAFDEQLDITGFIMTKLDGDARGGAALSIKEVTGKPIKFLGMGEDLERLEAFRPEGLASRILGMGDVVGLMEDFERVAEEDQEEKAMKMLQGQFSFRDFYEQISMIQKMGPLKDVIAKMPMQNMIPQGANIDERELVKIKAMIDSMTNEERVKPAVLNNSRVTRISRGSGRSETEVRNLIEKFKGMRKMMGMMGKNLGFLGKIPGLNQLSNLNQMRKMAKSMQGGGGGMPDFASMMGMGGGGGGGGGQAKRPVDRDKQKKLRKAAKAARKKNRR